MKVLDGDTNSAWRTTEWLVADVGIGYEFEERLSEDVKASVCRAGWTSDSGHQMLTSYHMTFFMEQSACRSLWAYFVGMDALLATKNQPKAELDALEMMSESMCDKESVMARYKRVPVEDLVRCAREELRWCRLLPLELRLRNEVYCQGWLGPGTIALVSTWCMVLWRMLGVDAVLPVVHIVLHWESMRAHHDVGCVSDRAYHVVHRTRKSSAGRTSREDRIANDLWMAWDEVLSAIQTAASLLGPYDYGFKMDRCITLVENKRVEAELTEDE